MKSTIFLLIASVLLAAIDGALAHDDAEWIMRDKRIAYCCGPRDCDVVPAERIKLGPTGYSVALDGRAIFVSYAEAKPSIDDRYWLCAYMVADGGQMTRHLRCLFAPRMGS